MGNNLSESELDDCDPIKTNRELGREYAVSGKSFESMGTLDEPAYPCGLVAKSYFNDTFELYDNGVTNITIDDSNIAWKSDVDYKFENLAQANWEDIQWMDVTNQHFIVWMRTAGLPNFRKLYGVIN